MKIFNKIILLILNVTFINNIFSELIDSILAQKVALNYFEFLQPQKKPLEILNTIIKYYNGYISYYIVNFKNGGYIIVSGDNSALPILSYSFNNTYYEENEIKNIKN